MKLFKESLLLGDLKLITKSRGIEGYKNWSEKTLLSSLSKPKIDNEGLENIREELNKLRQIFKTKNEGDHKNLYEIDSNKNLSIQKIKETENSISRLTKYHDYNDAEYIREVRNLFNQSIDKIITNQ